MIMKATDQFESDTMRKLRAAAAQSILDKTYKRCDGVLNFFGTLAILTQQHALDERIVWANFFYWLHGYWLATKEYIVEARQGDPTAWSSLEWFHSRTAAIEMQKTELPKSSCNGMRRQLKTFLLGKQNSNTNG
jgi:hypothetical protein